MKIDLQAYEAAVADGTLDHTWRACMMAVAAGADSVNGCVTAGWPRWLAEYGVLYFDRGGDDIARGQRFLTAVQAAEASGIDWDAACNTWRLDSILPIALESVGDGDEPWRERCRTVVRATIDNGGVCPDEKEAWGAAEAAEAAEAADTTTGASSTLLLRRKDRCP